MHHSPGLSGFDRATSANGQSPPSGFLSEILISPLSIPWLAPSVFPRTVRPSCRITITFRSAWLETCPAVRTIPIRADDHAASLRLAHQQTHGAWNHLSRKLAIMKLHRPQVRARLRRGFGHREQRVVGRLGRTRM